MSVHPAARPSPSTVKQPQCGMSMPCAEHVAHRDQEHHEHAAGDGRRFAPPEAGDEQDADHQLQPGQRHRQQVGGHERRARALGPISW